MPSRSGERCIALSLILSSLGITHLVDCNDMTFIPIAARSQYALHGVCVYIMRGCDRVDIPRCTPAWCRVREPVCYSSGFAEGLAMLSRIDVSASIFFIL